MRIFCTAINEMAANADPPKNALFDAKQIGAVRGFLKQRRAARNQGRMRRWFRAK